MSEGELVTVAKALTDWSAFGDALQKTVHDYLMTLCDEDRRGWIDGLKFCSECGADISKEPCYCMADD